MLPTILLTATVVAAAPAPAPSVVDVVVHGNRRISDERIMLSLPFTVGDRAGAAALAEAKSRVMATGYFASVEPQAEPVPGGERIVITVKELPPVDGVAVIGATLVPADRLEALFAPLKGDVLNTHALQTGIDQLQQVYRDAGFPLVRVADVGVDGYGTLRLRLVEATIHAVRIVGNTETKEYVIRRELTTRSGRPFDARRFEGDRRRLEALGYFDAVTPRFEPGPTPDEVDLVIEVKEGQTGSIDLGGDYSFQQGMIGRLGVQKDNLLGLGQRLGANVSVSQRLQVSGELTYANPWLDDAHTSLDGSLYVRRYNNFLADFREDRLGVSVNTTRPLFGTAFATPWIGTAGLRAETVGTYDNQLLGEAIKPTYASGQKITLSPSGTDAVIAGSFGMSYDTRDLALNPTEGWFNALTLEPGVVNGTSPLVRGTGAFNHFIPLPSVPWAPTERTVLAFGTRLGLITGPQVPAYERFYSTGPYLVRGWPEYATLQTIQSQNLPLNYFQGANAAVASLEYRFPIFNIVSGVLFGDTGMFWDNGFFDPNGHLLLHSGYGLGLRLNTPIGLVRADYGLNRFDLGQGQFHVSVGQKF